MKSSPAHKKLSSCLLWSLYLLCIFDLILALLKSDCCLAHNVANNGLTLKWTRRMTDMENKIATHFWLFSFWRCCIIKICSVKAVSCEESCTFDSSCSATSRPASANAFAGAMLIPGVELHTYHEFLQWDPQRSFSWPCDQHLTLHQATSKGTAMLWLLSDWELTGTHLSGEKWAQLVTWTTSKMWKERSLLIEQGSESMCCKK